MVELWTSLPRCGAAPPVPESFDDSLLEEMETEGLQAGELQLNELTLESMQHMCVQGRGTTGWAWCSRKSCSCAASFCSA